MSDDEIEWYTGSGMFNDPCLRCQVRRQEHDNEALGHVWMGEVFESSRLERLMNAFIRTRAPELRGEYSAPLPGPSDRRRIREASELTQREVAEKIDVSRATIHKSEKRAGWLPSGERLPGREPSGQVREDYSKLLRGLSGTDRITVVGVDPTKGPRSSPSETALWPGWCEFYRPD